MAKNKKDKAKEAAKLAMEPTIYVFNFKDTPIEKYTESLKLLFGDPDFVELVTKRNNLVKAAGRMRPNSAEIQSVIRSIQQRDRKLADLMYAIIVQSNIRSDVTYDLLTFDNLMKYYVDYSKEGMVERVDRLSANLDKLTFLSDMLESLLVDVKEDMKLVFGSAIEFTQFDGVATMMQQLRGFFKCSRDKSMKTEEDTNLYCDYADSINDYMEKRLKTYSVKYRKLHPRLPTYTAEQMMEAINLFFDSGKHFGMNFIKRTENNGAYIDAAALAYNLTPSQTDKLDKMMSAMKTKIDATKDPLNYSFLVTDAIMLYYQMNVKK